MEDPEAALQSHEPATEITTDRRLQSGPLTASLRGEEKR